MLRKVFSFGGLLLLGGALCLATPGLAQTRGDVSRPRADEPVATGDR